MFKFLRNLSKKDILEKLTETDRQNKLRDELDRKRYNEALEEAKLYDEDIEIKQQKYGGKEIVLLGKTIRIVQIVPSKVRKYGGLYYEEGYDFPLTKHMVERPKVYYYCWTVNGRIDIDDILLETFEKLLNKDDDELQLI